ncbi:MAG: hypothetical protein COA79_05540 [Planctomycetota bacterium]|nr:MAG: hypothetical protein COA79_05540 [Planctomycetota bacterium]
MKAIFFVSFFLLVSILSFSQESSRSLDENMKRLKQGYFPVTMRRKIDDSKKYNEHKIFSRICVQEPKGPDLIQYKKDGMPLYVYIFDGDGILYLKDFWKTSRKKFMETRSTKLLIRSPSLFDKAVQSSLFGRVRKFAKGYKNTDVLAMCVAHEASMTSFSSPLDFDISKNALNEFRIFLKSRYSKIADLNKAWSTTFKNFSSLEPILTDEIMDREYGNYPYMNLAPWFEFREFSDNSFIDLVHKLSDIVREESPATPTSVTVTAVPSAFGGWDYGRLLNKDKINVLETYEFPGDKGLIRGLTKGNTVNVCSLYTGRGNSMKLRAWRNFLNGERSNFFAGRGTGNFNKDGRPKEYQAEFDRMNKMAKLIYGAEIEDGGVRMIYSQPSVRCYWFIDTKPDGKTYPNRGSSFEIKHNTYMQVLGGWQDLLGELGCHPLFESNLDLEKGAFKHGVPKVLIANRFCSVSKNELLFIEKYVTQGGTLIIDESFALFDGKGNARINNNIPLINKPRTKLRATFGQVDLKNSTKEKAEIITIGKGKVVLLNGTVSRYGAGQSMEERSAIRTRVENVLGDNNFTVLEEGKKVFDIDIYRFKNEKNYIALVPTKHDVQKNISLKFKGKGAVLKNTYTSKTNDGEISLPKNRALMFEIIK